jgi:TP901 family phage tail tape measure protein
MGTRVENIRTNVYINDVTAGKNLREMSNESRKLRNEIALLTPGTQAFIEKTKQLQAVEARVRGVRNEINGTNNAWGKAANGFNKYAAMATAATAALAGFAIGIVSVIKRNAELSDSMADVMKTTGMTEKEVNELSASLQKLNTRTSRKELLGLAEEAGRLGMTSKKDVLEFVKAANQIKVALGDDLGGEEALREVGKLTQQFKIGENAGVGFEEAMLKLGSAINTVAASGANQASFQVDFMKRLSGVSQQAGFTADQVIGLAAALDEAGQSAEISGTTLNQVITNMFDDTATYAKVANMEIGDFTKLLNTDANAAFMNVLKGLKGNNDGYGVMVEKLQQLDIDGTRGIAVLASMAENIGNIEAKQSIANKAMAEGTSITQEYNTKNENLAAGWERLQRAMLGAFANSTITDGLANIVHWLNKMIEVPVSETMEEERMSMRMLELQIYDTNLPQEQRVKLIEELKNMYPQYLSHINADTISNSQLRLEIEKVNEQLVNKIVLQKEDEQVQEQIEHIAKKKMRFLQAEEEVLRKIVKLTEENNKENEKQVRIPTLGSTEFKALSVLEQLREIRGESSYRDEVVRLSTSIAQLQDAEDIYNGSLEVGNRLRKEREELAKKLGLDAVGTPAPAPTGGSGIPEGTTKEEGGFLWMFSGGTWMKIIATGGGAGDEDAVSKRRSLDEQIAQLHIQRIQDEQAREEAALQARYTKILENEALTNEQKKMLEEIYQQDLSNLKLKWQQTNTEQGLEDNLTLGLIELETSLQQELITQEQYNLQKLELEAAHLASMLAVKQQFGEDTLALEKDIAEKYTQIYNEKNRQITQVNKAVVKSDDVVKDAKIEGLQQLAGAMTTYVDRSSGLFKTLFVAEKAAAISQIIVNLQKEIAGLSAANAGLGVAGIPITAAQIVAAKIRSGIGVATVAAQSIGGLKKYAAGGYTGFGFGAADSTGFKPAGIVHDGEYVVPKWMMQDGYVANVVGMLENIRSQKNGFAMGGPTSTVVEKHSSVTNTTINQEKVEMLLAMIADKLDRPSVAVLPDATVRDIADRQAKDSVITNRSKLN